MKRILAMLLCLILLCGCAVTETVPDPKPPSLSEATAEVFDPVYLEEEAVALAAAPAPPVSTVLKPEASGQQEKRSTDAVIDYSHTKEGYVMAKYLTKTDKRLKVQVKGPKTTYTYNLPQGQWTVFPLSDGNGSYQVIVYRNVADSQYATVLSAAFSVTLEDEFAPFLRPNQYVNYTNAKNTVAKGAALCAGLEDPLDKVAAVYDYVVDTLRYDAQKASTVTSGYLPVLDTVLKEKKGICFDYAALMAAMLRSQNVPCKLAVGYADQVYHAWISVWTERDGWVDGVIFFDGSSWKRMDPTFASSGKRSREIMDYIEHGNYTVKYLY